MLRRFGGKAGESSAYHLEQWDVMFFVQGRVEMILRDLRAGLPRITMRFFVDGDNHRSANNAGIVIPPGVAHALRVEGNEDIVMVYGTSTTFRPDFEGRWRFAGISLLSNALARTLEPVPSGLYEQVWSRGPIDLVPADITFIDCGTPEDLAKARRLGHGVRENHEAPPIERQRERQLEASQDLQHRGCG